MFRRSSKHACRAVAVGAALTACAWSGTALAYGKGFAVLPPETNPKSADGLPPQLEGVGIDPTLGLELPKDVALTDQDGKAVTFGEYVRGDKPVLLLFAYYSCPMLCTLVLNGALDALKTLGREPGTDYRVVTVSFDPRDTTAIAREKRANYVSALGRNVAERGWDFLIGSEAEVGRLAKAAGFKYRWDETESQYAHAAGMYVLSPDGKVSRVLYGVRFEGSDVRLAMADAMEGRTVSLTDRILLFCFHYEPKQGKYILAAQRLMKAAGALTVMAVATTVVMLRRGERRRGQGPVLRAAEQA